MKTKTAPSCSFMEGAAHIHVIRQYLDYVEEHLKNVQASWKRLQEADRLAHKAGFKRIINDDFLFWTIDSNIRGHDVSKLSAEELVPYAEWFYGKYGRNYDLWDDGGCGKESHKRVMDAYNKAWEHHKACNLHHWETWTTAESLFPDEWFVHCVCMVVDWMAMAIKFGDTAEEYYNQHKEEINLTGEAHCLCMKIFDLLRVYG